LTAIIFSDYNTDMGRPRKYGKLRMDTDLRIPLTTEQKSLIDAATAGIAEGKAEWARALLLKAAQRMLAKGDVDMQCNA
jgi:hypothetical protein